jgi:hypothetical protein
VVNGADTQLIPREYPADTGAAHNRSIDRNAGRDQGWEVGEMRNTLQRPPVEDVLEVLERAEPETGSRRPGNTAVIVAAIVGFVLAAVAVAVLLSGDGTILEEVVEPTIAQRDLAPALRPRETDVIVLDMAGLDSRPPVGGQDDPSTWGWGTWEVDPVATPPTLGPSRPRETDVIVLDMAGLGTGGTGAEDTGTPRPHELDPLVPQ